jgi:hypothetical protein
MKTSVLALALAATVTLGASQASAAVVMDAINPGGTSSSTWAADEVGWFYTPTFSYSLSGIGTKFGSSDGRTVTAEIFSGVPGSLTLLASGNLTPIANAFSDAFFSAINLTAGTTYFVAFEHVSGLATNVTDTAGATNLAGGLRYSFSSNNSFDSGPETQFTAQPMIEFIGGRGGAVPEPATWAMMVLGFGTAGAALRRRRPALVVAKA